MESRTIDLTPTRSEMARTTAYALAMHSDGSPYEYGDYWEYTEIQENAIFATWNALTPVVDAYKLAGMNYWTDVPKTQKSKLIKNLFAYALAELSK